jgi:hypothetical protein
MQLGWLAEETARWRSRYRALHAQWSALEAAGGTGPSARALKSLKRRLQEMDAAAEAVAQTLAALQQKLDRPSSQRSQLRPSGTSARR